MITVQDALKHFGLEALPSNTSQLRRLVATSPMRIAVWQPEDVENYQLLFNTVLGISRRRKNRPTPPVRRVNGTKAA